jgi:hypothetical protein
MANVTVSCANLHEVVLRVEAQFSISQWERILQSMDERPSSWPADVLVRCIRDAVRKAQERLAEPVEL